MPIQLILADTGQRFLIPNANVDTSTVAVRVQNSASDTAVVTWADGNSLDVTTITSTTESLFSARSRRTEI